MGLGLAAGLVGGTAVADRVGWLGTLFVRLLKMIIIPLVITSIITGVASVGGGRSLGRLFSKTLGFYLLSSALAVLTGLAVLNVIQPGVGAEIAGAHSGELPELQTANSVTELLLNMVPLNVIDAAAKPDMLGVIFFCILFGVAIAGLPENPREKLLGLFDAAFQAMMTLTSGIIRLAPIGVFALIARVAGTSGLDAFRALGLYMISIALGLAIHMGITLPVLLRVLGGISPRVHFRNMVNPLTMAFSTSSSAATLPVTLRAVHERVGVSNRVSSFVLPMGATVNMDGTALYECGGVLFIAQVLGVDLSISQQFVVVVTALLASIGAAAVPSAGLVVIFLVLESVNLRGPEVDVIVGAMLAIDRPLDMCRTATNVFSDSCGAAIIARSEGEAGVDAA
ncbi:MAG: dicarboxylate/amino acid:cation symporter [Deltaproteobacteria bacterium]|nr:dicarboxylate/amino acid:cation symporter [Deltaproteobacteria bacterium]MBW2444858.1 dicarboxylate/amino acid:cation symporter [Deltaproteobacteria bacterium]